MDAPFCFEFNLTPRVHRGAFFRPVLPTSR